MPLNMISNFAANVAHRNLLKSDTEMTDSLSKLSAGTRVLAAKDDAASMAIGSRLRAEVKALAQAVVNSGQAISMLQVADGAMARTQDIMLRMKTLSVQAGSGQLSSVERGMLNTEYKQLVSEVDRLSLDTEFNSVLLLNGAYGVTQPAGFAPADGMQDVVFRGRFFTPDTPTISYDSAGQLFTVTTLDVNNSAGTMNFTGAISTDFQDGTTMTTGNIVTLTNASVSHEIDLLIDETWVVNGAPAPATIGLTGQNYQDFTYKVGTGVLPQADEITVSLTSMSAASLGISTTDVTTVDSANMASQAVSAAVDYLNTSRADVGASQNRLEFAAANIATTQENMEAARSNLLDLDVAAEMSRFTSRQMLVQAGVAMLAQANQTPQNLIRLFQ